MRADVSHNIAKVEEHFVDGEIKKLLVHRKGATRAFPPHHPLIPVDYQVGQPACVLFDSLSVSLALGWRGLRTAARELTLAVLLLPLRAHS